MHKPNPADELAELRAEIARLETRETALRQQILNAAHPVLGRWHRAEVEETNLLAFDPRLLPPAVRDNPDYWRERVVTVVRCVSLVAGQLPRRSGWPIVIDNALH